MVGPNLTVKKNSVLSKSSEQDWPGAKATSAYVLSFYIIWCRWQLFEYTKHFVDHTNQGRPTKLGMLTILTERDFLY